MAAKMPGSFHLFRALGVDVYLHWMWFLLAFILVPMRSSAGQMSMALAASIYVALFVIVLLHEYGHALACKSVGGKAERIVLWPLGGIAFVQPPPRPWPMLWSIAAGPLVNVALIPVTVAAWMLSETWLGGVNAEVTRFFAWIAVINISLLVFNMLPIFPLDGGQILQGLLWLLFGGSKSGTARGRSLVISGWIGIVAGVVGGVGAVVTGEIFLAVIAGFVGLQAWQGVRVGRALLAREAMGGDPWETLRAQVDGWRTEDIGVGPAPGSESTRWVDSRSREVSDDGVGGEPWEDEAKSGDGFGDDAYSDDATRGEGKVEGKADVDLGDEDRDGRRSSGDGSGRWPG